MSLVLDSSVALSWCFEDERTPATAAVLEQVTEQGAVVPAIWRLEVANALQSGLRRGRIDAAFRDASLGDLALLEITDRCRDRQPCLGGDAAAGGPVPAHGL